MTISVTDAASGPYYPNGATVNFPFDFSVEDGSEVRVFRINADGSEDVISPAGYAVTIATDGEGGTVVTTAPPAADGRPLWVAMDPSFEQQILFEDEGPFNSAVLNPVADRAARRSIYLKAQLDRAIQLPFGETFPGFPGVAGRASKFWGFGPDGSFQLLAGTGSATDASAVALIYGEAGARLRNMREKFNRESVSILDFTNNDGSAPCQGADDSVAMARALATGRKVRIPNGLRVRCNVVSPPSFWIEGDTTKLSMIEPFDKTKAAIKVVWDNLYWSYCRVIENILFINADPASGGYVARSGIGVAMGRTGPADFADVGPYPMYSGGMVFRNVSFRDLRKGFVSGCGNIGVEFYACNAASCYYGYYFQDNKNTAANGNAGPSFSDGMHAGNKYFYGGEIDDCDCGVYIHNVTEGFGAVIFYGTIIEYNKIGVYLYSDNVYFPIAFHDVWNEGNGQTAISTPRGNVIIDAWAGGVRSDLSHLARTLIVEGTRVAINHTGGFFTDVRMTATNSRITVRDAHVEAYVGYGGSGHYVDDPSSKIILDGCKTNGGVASFMNVLSRGVVHNEQAGSPSAPTVGYNPSGAATRHFHVPARLDKQYGSGQYATGGAESLSIGYTRARPFTGFTNYTPVVGPGGRTFPLVSNFDITTANSAQFLLDANASFTTGTAGWYVVTWDIRRLDGLDVNIFIGDLSTTQIVAAVGTIGTEWMTNAALAYLPAGRTLYPSFQPVSPGRTVFQFSAYQVRRFNTRVEAEAFIADGVYIVDSDDMFMDANVALRWRSGNIYPWRMGPNPFNGTFEMFADPATAKRWDIGGFGFRFDADYGTEWSWAGGAARYLMKADTAVSGDLVLNAPAGTSGVLRAQVHINLDGKELRSGGNKVVGARQAAVGDAANAAAAPTQAEFNAFVAKFNLLLDKLGVSGHGLTADP